MPFAISHGVRLYYETAGEGVPVVFVHEFSGDLTQLGSADPLLQPPLPLHRVQRARLPALGRARVGLRVFLDAPRWTTSPP